MFRLVHRNLTDSKVGRGLNVIVVDGKTFQVKLIDTFDTYAAGRTERNQFSNKSIRIDNFLLRLMKLTLNTGDILIMASYDEMIHG